MKISPKNQLERLKSLPIPSLMMMKCIEQYQQIYLCLIRRWIEPLWKMEIGGQFVGSCEDIGCCSSLTSSNFWHPPTTVTYLFSQLSNLMRWLYNLYRIELPDPDPYVFPPWLKYHRELMNNSHPYGCYLAVGNMIALLDRPPNTSNCVQWQTFILSSEWAENIARSLWKLWKKEYVVIHPLVGKLFLHFQILSSIHLEKVIVSAMCGVDCEQGSKRSERSEGREQDGVKYEQSEVSKEREQDGVKFEHSEVNKEREQDGVNSEHSEVSKEREQKKSNSQSKANSKQSKTNKATQSREQNKPSQYNPINEHFNKHYTKPSNSTYDPNPNPNSNLQRQSQFLQFSTLWFLTQLHPSLILPHLTKPILFMLDSLADQDPIIRLNAIQWLTHTLHSQPSRLLDPLATLLLEKITTFIHLPHYKIQYDTRRVLYLFHLLQHIINTSGGIFYQSTIHLPLTREMAQLSQKQCLSSRQRAKAKAQGPQREEIAITNYIEWFAILAIGFISGTEGGGYCMEKTYEHNREPANLQVPALPDPSDPEAATILNLSKNAHSISLTDDLTNDLTEHSTSNTKSSPNTNPNLIEWLTSSTTPSKEPPLNNIVSSHKYQAPIHTTTHNGEVNQCIQTMAAQFLLHLLSQFLTFMPNQAIRLIDQLHSLIVNALIISIEEGQVHTQVILLDILILQLPTVTRPRQALEISPLLQSLKPTGQMLQIIKMGMFQSILVQVGELGTTGTTLGTTLGTTSFTSIPPHHDIPSILSSWLDFSQKLLPHLHHQLPYFVTFLLETWMNWLRQSIYHQNIPIVNELNWSQVSSVVAILDAIQSLLLQLYQWTWIQIHPNNSNDPIDSIEPSDQSNLDSLDLKEDSFELDNSKSNQLNSLPTNLDQWDTLLNQHLSNLSRDIHSNSLSSTPLVNVFSGFIKLFTTEGYNANVSPPLDSIPLIAISNALDEYNPLVELLMNIWKTMRWPWIKCMTVPWIQAMSLPKRRKANNSKYITHASMQSILSTHVIQIFNTMAQLSMSRLLSALMQPWQYVYMPKPAWPFPVEIGPSDSPSDSPSVKQSANSTHNSTHNSTRHFAYKNTVVDLLIHLEPSTLIHRLSKSLSDLVELTRSNDRLRTIHIAQERKRGIQLVNIQDAPILELMVIFFSHLKFIHSSNTSNDTAHTSSPLSQIITPTEAWQTWLDLIHSISLSTRNPHALILTFVVLDLAFDIILHLDLPVKFKKNCQTTVQKIFELSSTIPTHTFVDLCCSWEPVIPFAHIPYQLWSQTPLDKVLVKWTRYKMIHYLYNVWDHHLLSILSLFDDARPQATNILISITHQLFLLIQEESDTWERERCKEIAFHLLNHILDSHGIEFKYWRKDASEFLIYNNQDLFLNQSLIQLKEMKNFFNLLFTSTMDEDNHLSIKTVKSIGSSLINHTIGKLNTTFNSNLVPIGLNIVWTEWMKILSRNILPPTLFTNSSQASHLRNITLKKLSFIIFSGQVDQYASKLPWIQEKVIEALKNREGDDDTFSMVFQCLRILLIRIHESSMRPFWPVIIAEILYVFRQETPKPQLILPILKFIDLVSILPSEQFHFYEWIFIHDPPIDQNTSSNKQKSSTFVPLINRLIQTSNGINFKERKIGQRLTLTDEIYHVSLDQVHLDSDDSSPFQSWPQFLQWLEHYPTIQYNKRVGLHTLDWENIEQTMLAEFSSSG